VRDAQELKSLGNFGLLSLKPQLIVLNIGEQDIGGAPGFESEYRQRHSGQGTAVSVLSAKLEAELAELPADEAAEFRLEMGAGEGGTHAVLERVLELLGLITFFTVGEKEARAWTVPARSSALQAAGRIHTDIERGFIRAEVIGWERLLELGSHQEAKRKGELRTEGKQYVVREGDVINVLFNV